MSAVYQAIGKLVVSAIMFRFGRQVRIAGALGLAGLLIGGAIGAYLIASREVEEG
jgi:hypothetical protein